MGSHPALQKRLVTVMMEERGESTDPVLKLTTCRFAAKWIAPRPFLTAACKPNNFAESTLANTASRSMSVQERGRARVYAYSCPRATQQQCRPCQQKEPERERKRNAGRSFSISSNSRKGCGKENSQVKCTVGATHLLGRHFSYGRGSNNVLTSD